MSNKSNINNTVAIQADLVRPYYESASFLYYETRHKLYKLFTTIANTKKTCYV